MTLDAHEFIRRFLLHCLPDGFHRIRHYGFAYIIGNWNSLARIVFESFTGLGLMASGTVFDDGRRVYIVFPAGIVQGEMPQRRSRLIRTSLVDSRVSIDHAAVAWFGSRSAR